MHFRSLMLTRRHVLPRSIGCRYANAAYRRLLLHAPEHQNRRLPRDRPTSLALTQPAMANSAFFSASSEARAFTIRTTSPLFTVIVQVPVQACKVTACQLYKTTCTAHLTTFAHSLCVLANVTLFSRDRNRRVGGAGDRVSETTIPYGKS